MEKVSTQSLFQPGTVMQDGKCRHWGHKFRGWEEKPPKHNIYCLLRIPFYFPMFACPWALPVWYSLSSAGLPFSTHKLWPSQAHRVRCFTLPNIRHQTQELPPLPNVQDKAAGQAVKHPPDRHRADESSLKVNTQHSYHSSHSGRMKSLPQAATPPSIHHGPLCTVLDKTHSHSHPLHFKPVFLLHKQHSERRLRQAGWPCQHCRTHHLCHTHTPRYFSAR